MQKFYNTGQPVGKPSTSTISRVSDQNGVSLLYIMLEVHHSGREPSICCGHPLCVHSVKTLCHIHAQIVFDCY